MQRRLFLIRASLIGALTFALALCAFPARAAEAVAPVPLTLTGYALGIGGPDAPADVCDMGSELHCGLVYVTADFSGLSGRTPPTEPVYPDGDLTGTVHVTRTYGCQDAGGRRLHRYDVTVGEVAYLDTRRDSGYFVVEGDDDIEVTTYAFLLDRQPHNCPAGTTAMTYKIRAKKAKVTLDSYWDSIPSSTYSTPGWVRWAGAVPTPTGSLS